MMFANGTKMQVLQSTRTKLSPQKIGSNNLFLSSVSDKHMTMLVIRKWEHLPWPTTEGLIYYPKIT